ncbi:MAG: divalent metal cation transporter [Verrucomicrobia bacterium]|nr:divalent metal cation transporter [Verrucomicrobiota bacterium]MBV9299245.1 divalent metal cation transporter [Verrucomicrobiota bacterium]
MAEEKKTEWSDVESPIRPESLRDDVVVPALASESSGWLRNTLKFFGPGLVTGAADDDPSGIATYSSVGAQFGYGMLWTMPFIYPFMAGIQEISARLGRITGRGIAGNIRLFYPTWMLYAIVVLLLIANVINIGADIGAMGAAAELLIGGSTLLYCVVFALVSVLLQVFIPYKTYSVFLKWLTLSLFAYVGTVFVVQINWREVLQATCIPDISLKREHLAALIAVLGTTISPYLLFWQSAEEVKQMENAPAQVALKKAPLQAPEQFQRIKVDTYVGMAFSNFIAYFIILTTAVTLHAHGKTDINTTAQAAEALRPIAGVFASLLFSLGVIGTGLLALPVLGGSAAYAVGEALRWPVGLERKAKEAKAFYAVLVVATMVGLALNFTKVDPIRALVGAAIINGATAAPVMCLMMLLASRRKVMGKLILPGYLKILGWTAAAIMAFAAAGLFFTSGK